MKERALRGGVGLVFVRRGYSATGGAEAYLRRLAGVMAGMGVGSVLVGQGWPREEWPWGEVVEVEGRGPMGFARGVRDVRRRRSLEGRREVYFSLDRVPGCEVFRAGDGVHAAWLERRERFEGKWRVWVRRLLGRKHREILRLEREVLGRGGARIVIANSAMVAREIEERYGFSKERIRIIRNGVDGLLKDVGGEGFERRRGEWRREMGVGEGEVVGLFVGSGWERKGLRYAVEAVRGVRGVRLWVVGQGKWSGKADERVVFWGGQRDLERFWTCGDFFILPTWYDPFSNASLEALVAGLPVVTTVDNGFAEVVEEGVTGSVVGRADAVGELRAAVEWWVGELRRDGRGVRRRCVARGGEWTMGRNVEATLEVVGEVVGICS